MPLRRTSRTVAVIRLLKTLGPLPSRRRMPRQQQPDAIRVAYWRALMPHVEKAKRALAAETPEIMSLLAKERRARGKEDADGSSGPNAKRALELVQRAGAVAANNFAPKAVREVALKFGKQTSDFQREQLDKQVRAAFAVPLSAVEAPVRDKLEEFAATNVDLIKTVPERYFDRIRTDVEDAFAEGTTPAELADEFELRFGMAEDDALRIARDQLGKLSGELNEARQEAMGVEGYVWRGAMDNRERDNHRDLEGRECSWDDPPMGGGTDEDEPGHPGSGIQCRCYAEPIFRQLQEGVEEG